MRYFWSFLILLSFFSCSDDFFPNEPGALVSCSVGNLQVTVGDCKEDGTYSLELDFSVANPTNESFELFQRGDDLIDFYALRDLPLTIENFQPSGLVTDFLSVCINDNSDCCTEIEFMPPPCLAGTPMDSTFIDSTACAITMIETGVGDCTSDSTYILEIDFEYINAGNEFYDLFVREEVIIDSFNLEELPLRLDDFPASGLENDFIRVCINDTPDCCLEIEFMPPDCIE